MKRVTIIFLLLFGVLLTGCDGAADPIDTTSAVTTEQTAKLSGEEYQKFQLYYPRENKTVTAQSNEALFEAFAQLMASYSTYDTMELTVQMQGVIADKKRFDSIPYTTFDEWNSDRDPYVHIYLSLKYNGLDVDDWLALAAADDVIFVKVTIPFKFEVFDD